MDSLKYAAGRPGCLASRKIAELARYIADSRRILADLHNDQAQFAKCLSNMFLAAARNELAGDAIKPASAKQAVAIDRGKQFESFEGEVAAIVASEVLADPQAVFKLTAFAEFILGGVVERAELMNKFAIS